MGRLSLPALVLNLQLILCEKWFTNCYFELFKFSTFYFKDDFNKWLIVFQGHKWTLSNLWAYLGEQGIEARPVQDNIRDLVSH